MKRIDRLVERLHGRIGRKIDKRPRRLVDMTGTRIGGQGEDIRRVARHWQHQLPQITHRNVLQRGEAGDRSRRSAAAAGGEPEPGAAIGHEAKGHQRHIDARHRRKQQPGDGHAPKFHMKALT